MAEASTPQRHDVDKVNAENERLRRAIRAARELLEYQGTDDEVKHTLDEALAEPR